MFLFSEADVNAKDRDGNTALHLSQIIKPTMVNYSKFYLKKMHKTWLAFLLS